MSSIEPLNLDSFVGPNPLPPITSVEEQRAREAAASGKQGILLYADPHYSATEQKDTAHLLGWRVVGPDGRFTGQFSVNRHYVPHPISARVDLSTPLDLAMWRVVHGFLPISAFIEALTTADLHGPVDPAHDLRVDIDSEGERVLHLFTTEPRIPWNLWPYWREVTGLEVLETAAANTGWITINHDCTTSFRIQTRRLATLWRDYRERETTSSATVGTTVTRRS